MGNSITTRLQSGKYNKLRIGKLVYNLEDVEIEQLTVRTCRAKANYILYGTNASSKVEGKLVFTTSECLTFAEASRELIIAINDFLEAKDG